jgi:hypothetical protein
LVWFGEIGRKLAKLSMPRLLTVLPLNYFMRQAYYREGVALQCLGRHAEALAAFSSGLAQAGVTKCHTPFINNKETTSSASFTKKFALAPNSREEYISHMVDGLLIGCQ